MAEQKVKTTWFGHLKCRLGLHPWQQVKTWPGGLGADGQPQGIHGFQCQRPGCRARTLEAFGAVTVSGPQPRSSRMGRAMRTATRWQRYWGKSRHYQQRS